MHWLILVLRTLHIGAGVFWAGAAFVVAAFILPTAAAAGPEGGRFVRRLALERGLTRTMIAAGVTTVVAGLALLWIDSAGMRRAWMGSGMGAMISLGALAGLGALVTGIRTSVTASRMGKLAAAVEGQGGAPSPEQAGQLQQLQARMASGARAVAIQLAVAVLCMAVARYTVF